MLSVSNVSNKCYVLKKNIYIISIFLIFLEVQMKFCLGFLC